MGNGLGASNSGDDDIDDFEYVEVSESGSEDSMCVRQWRF